jgi:hypothetical protein
MTDRERHRLQGPVRSLRVEWASIDPQTRDWEPPKQGPTFTSIAMDGRKDGSATKERPSRRSIRGSNVEGRTIAYCDPSATSLT